MRTVRIVTAGCAVLVCGCATQPSTPASRATGVIKTTPLILEKNEGERRVVRGWPGHPDPGETFVLKVDPTNGGSTHLVFLTADLPPGKVIEPHRHPGADEIIFLQTGTARVQVGDSVRVVHAGATVFIPADTWVSVVNTGRDVLSLAGVLSTPGFEDFMRAASVREGEKNVPVSQAEEEEMEKKHSHDVIYKAP